MSQQQIRLPTHVRPHRYRITIKPDLDNFTFEGEETIALILIKPSREITLHSKDLDITGAEFVHANKEIWAAKIIYNEKKETATFKFKQELPNGKGKLKLSFRGILNDKLRGFYRSSYLHKGVKKHLATTQFEATDARRAFPCFDEPAHKAIFEVTLIVPAGLVAISNTIPSSIGKAKPGHQIVKFQPTPKMSTYLLAFIVGDFEFIEGKTRQGVKVRVFTTPGKTHQAKFALEVAIKTLSFLQKYFGIAYPLPSMDLIAIPDFAHGAMENWGAVTYRETAILVDPKNSSTLTKQHVAYVIAHELAHQWFGNLVTMEWWTHLWLNESFATYIGYLAIDELFPKWQIWTQFVYSDLGMALKLDSLNTTHAIEIPVEHPDEISEIFDPISYEKGASVVRMLANYLGQKYFRDGLRYYLTKHSYKNTSTIHLWEAFEKISSKPVRKIMDVWTKKPGYPLIEAKLRGKELKLHQSRFFFNPVSKQKAEDRTTWPVPLTMIDGTDTNEILLNKKTGSIKTKPKPAFVKLNFGETGFYRVKYDSKLLKKLQKAVAKGALSAADRIGIIRDIFALAQSGKISTVIALETPRSYKKEESYTVWIEITTALNELSTLLYEEKYYPEFKQFVLQILKPIIRKVGWEMQRGESYSKSLLRALILAHAAKFDHKPTITKAQKLFWQYVKQKQYIAPDLKTVIYNTTATYGGQKEYAALKKLYRQATFQEEKNRLARALTCFTNKNLVDKTLRFCISSQVRSGDSPGLLAYAFRKEANQQYVWSFIQKNWKLFLHRYGQGGSMLKYLIAPAGTFHSEKKRQLVKKFFKNHEAPGANRMVTQVLESIEGNTLWLQRDKEEIKNFLETNTAERARL